MKWTSISLTAVLCLSPSCTRTEAAAPASAEVNADARPAAGPLTVQRSNRENKDCWLVRIDGNEGVAVWLSPRLAGEVEGGFRFVNLFFHDPGQPAPMATLTGVGVATGADPVAVSHGQLRLSVAPISGMTWGEVEQPEHLKVDRPTH